MRSLASIALLLCSLTIAHAQPVQQTGPVTPGHAASWITNGVIGDGGTAAGGGPITSFSTNGPGPTLCANSAIPGSGPYNQICLGATQTGGGSLSLYNYGGASGGLTFCTDGTCAAFNGGFTSLIVGTTQIQNGAANQILQQSGNVLGEVITGNNCLYMTGNTGAPECSATFANNTLTLSPANNANALAVSGYMVTGADTHSMLNLSGQLDTTGNVNAITLNLVNTACGTCNFLSFQSSGGNVFSVSLGGAVTVGQTLLLGKLYSAAGTALPTCNSGNEGAHATVSDATSPTYHGSYSSGGSVVSPVFCNGSNWLTD